MSKEHFEARQNQLSSLAEYLSSIGFSIENVPGDGSCQFHATVLSAGLEVTASELRKDVIAHMAHNPNQFAPFVHGMSWSDYLSRLKLSATWGGHLTLVAISEILGRPIVVHSFAAVAEPMILPLQVPEGQPEPAVINVAFDPECHYQAVLEGSGGDAAGQAGSDTKKRHLWGKQCPPRFRAQHRRIRKETKNKASGYKLIQGTNKNQSHNFNSIFAK